MELEDQFVSGIWVSRVVVSPVDALTDLWFARPPLQPDVIDYPPHRRHHLMDPRGRHACQQRVSLGCELQMRDECGVGWGLSQQSDSTVGYLGSLCVVPRDVIETSPPNTTGSRREDGVNRGGRMCINVRLNRLPTVPLNKRNEG